jgi:hypothetical protein
MVRIIYTTDLKEATLIDKGYEPIGINNISG